jgi:indole-3-glycerol phosphate synthase
MARAARLASPPRDLLATLAKPGLHVIAEVKRRSPSAGELGPGRGRPRPGAAYERGGAAAISVLCEPHWFDGSLDDLRAVRSAVGVPVLAKEFVVDPRQLAVLRGAGADLVLLLAVLHNARSLRSSCARHARWARAAGRGARRTRAGPRAVERRAPDRRQQPRPQLARRSTAARRATARA